MIKLHCQVTISPPPPHQPTHGWSPSGSWLFFKLRCFVTCLFRIWLYNCVVWLSLLGGIQYWTCAIVFTSIVKLDVATLYTHFALQWYSQLLPSYLCTQWHTLVSLCSFFTEKFISAPVLPAGRFQQYIFMSPDSERGVSSRCKNRFGHLSHFLFGDIPERSTPLFDLSKTCFRQTCFCSCCCSCCCCCLSQVYGVSCEEERFDVFHFLSCLSV